MDGVSLPGAREATTPSEERRGWDILCLEARSVCDKANQLQGCRPIRESFGFDRGFSVMMPCCIADTGWIDFVVDAVAAVFGIFVGAFGSRALQKRRP
jgi:hypothetical protein